MAKYVLITPNRENEKLNLNQAYTKILTKRGIVPIICDYVCPMDYIDIISGIILSGGGDLGKNLLSEPIHKKAVLIDDERDLFETSVIKSAVKKRIPILGICRGMQVLNSALGGTLNQHITGHSQKNPRNKASHNININKGTMLHNILKSSKTEVNSFHHQCISKLSEYLKISAYSDDNIPEAAEWAYEDYFCIGVQWHPEALSDINSEKLFDSFSKECINYKKR